MHTNNANETNNVNNEGISIHNYSFHLYLFVYSHCIQENIDMGKSKIVYLLFLAMLVFSCRKGIEPDELQGTWIEQDGVNSKLIFDGDLFYFFHDVNIDTSTYTLDEKHATMWTVPLDSSSGGNSYQLEWHKRKKILVVMGLFPSAFGNVSKNYYKKQ